MDEEIDLADIFHVLCKRRQLIIGIFVLSILVSGAISFALPSVYKVSSIIAVGNFEDPVYTSQASVKSIMLSDEFLLDVFKQIYPGATNNEFAAFKNSVKVEPVKNNEKLIEISIETPKGKEGKEAIEMMIWLYANRSEDSYNAHKKILSDQAAITKERLSAIDTEIDLTLGSMTSILDSTDSSDAGTELRYSRALDRLSDMEIKRSALTNSSLNLEKQLLLLKNLETVQPARAPISPIGPNKSLMVAIAGILGLILGIMAAFLREGLVRMAE